MILLALLLALILPITAHAAAIEHAHASISSDVTTSSNTFTDVTGATLASGNFTTSKKYLIDITAQCTYTSGDGTEMRVVHGSTAFDGSQSWVDASSTGWRQTYHFMTVWTAVSSEGIALQFRSRNGGANVASCNFADVFVMNLSDDLTENTDWHFAEVSADDAMSTSFEDGASITFTPAIASHDWLLLGQILTDSGAQITNYVTVRMTDGTTVLPQAQVDIGVSTRDEKLYGLARVVTLPASSATWKMQYKISASTTGTHLHSKIFALDLHKFRNHAIAQTDAGTALSATDWATQIQTASITPDVQGDVWIGAYWSYDKNTSGNMANQRLQIDNSDQPSGQTAAVDNYRGGIDGTDEEPMSITTMVTNMTAAAHTIDVDGSVDATTGTPEAETRALRAVTMELPAAVTSSKHRMLLGVGQ
jgi:hypothetical protein